MSAQNILNNLEVQLANLEQQKQESEEKIAKLRTNALANKTRGNVNAAKQKIKMFLMHEKRIAQLNGMIHNINVMISKVLQTRVNKVSSILARPLMKMTAENEAALEAEMKALTQNAATTSSAEHAAYVTNMRRGLENAVAAAGAGAGNGTPLQTVVAVKNAGPQPTPGSPAYYNWLSKTMPPVNTTARLATQANPAPLTGFGIPVMGAPTRVGGKSRRRHGRLSKSRRRSKKTIRRRR
jgi:hypothetical protein